ncbi:MAG: DMT family transporter [Bacillota bacterium]
MNLAWTGTIIVLLIALASGILMAVQGSLNSAFAKIIGLLEATFVVHATAALILVIALFLFKLGQGNFANYDQVPWYLYLGGAIGILITYGVVATIPKVGVAIATTAIIVGQVTTACLVDHFGLFGLQKIPFTWLKLVGIILLAAGAKLMLVR